MPTPKPPRLAAALLLGFLAPFVSATPSIFNSTQSAAAADIVGLQGANYTATPSVWIATVGPSGLDGSATALPLIDSTPTFATSRIPSGYASGLYKVWIADSAGVASAPAFINRAEITRCEFPEVDPGRSFRLFGRNLRLAGATPAVRFVNTATLASTAGVVLAGGDRYLVTVQAPATLTPGQTYTVCYTNGFGGGVGETAAPVALAARAGGTDAFALGVPWGADYAPFSGSIHNVRNAPYHAAADGVTDDTAALQAAIDAASAAGGGVVYLPAGTYKLATFGGTSGGVALTLKTKVVLKGDGQAATTLAFAAPNAISGAAGMIQAPTGAHTLGLMDLTLINTSVVTGGGMNSFFSVANDTARAFVLRVTLDGGEWATAGLRLTTTTGGRFLVSGCTVKNLRRDGRALQLKDAGGTRNTTQHAYLRNNHFPNFNVGLQLGGKDVLFENNTLTFDGDYYTRLTTTLGQAYGDGGTQNRINLSGPDAVVLNNTFTHTGAAFINQNDGENILAEDAGYGGGAPQATAVTTSATATTVTDSTRAWTAGGYVDYQVVIVDGTGKGQWRAITASTATTLTVSPAWTVAPAAGSKLAIGRLNVPRLLVKGNVITGKEHAVVLYMGAFKAAIVDNTATDSKDLWVRSILSPSGSANVLLDVLVAGNTLVATGATKPSYFEANVFYEEATRFGTGAFLVEFRKNTVTAKGVDAYRALNLYRSPNDSFHPQGDAAPAAFEGLIYDGNTAIEATNAYGWIPGIDGLAVANGTQTQVSRVLYDLSHRDGAWVGTPGWNAGTLSLNGSNYLDLSTTAVPITTGTLTFPETMTIEGRFKTAAASQVLISNRPVGKALVQIHSTGKLALYNDGFLSSVLSPAVVTDNAWHHFAWVSTGTTQKLYLDGVLAATSAYVRTASTGRGWIGSGAGSNNFTGELDEIRVWDIARTPAEIAAAKDRRLAGDEPGLIQYWRFSETAGRVAKSAIPSFVLQDGLVGSWRLDEALGSTGADSSGLGHTATVQGTPVWTTGWFQQALDLNGASHYLTVADAPALNATAALTVHARVRPDSISPSWNLNYRGIVAKGDPSAAHTGWELGTYGSNTAGPPVGFYFRRGTSSGSVVSCYGTANLVAGRYYAVDAVWDAATGKISLYVDGVLQATQTHASTLPASGSDLWIGRRASGGGQYFDGVIDDVKLFNRALSAQEIAELNAP